MPASFRSGVAGASLSRHSSETYRRDLTIVANALKKRKKRIVDSSWPILALVVACSPGGPTGDLTPLSGRPEDPDATRVYDQNDLMPSVSPDGREVLFTSRRSGNFRLYVMNLDGSDQRVLSSGPGAQMQGSWSPDAQRIAYVQRDAGGKRYAVMRADGSAPRVLTEAPRSWPIPSWSADGRWIMVHANGPFGSDDIWRIDVESGEAELVLGSEAAERHPVSSPDGSQLLFISRRDGADFEIYVAPLAGGSWIQLTENEEDDYNPSWSPDGSRVLFQGLRGGRWTIITMRSDGSDQTAITHYPEQWDPVWTPDGAAIVFNSARDGRRGLYRMDRDGWNQRKLTNTEPGSFVTTVRKRGVDEAARLYREAQKQRPGAVYFYEKEVKHLGDLYLEMGDLRRARLLFELNVDAYPESKQAHLDLGEAFLASRDNESALASYQRAFEIDSEDELVASRIERLTQQMRARR